MCLTKGRLYPLLLLLTVCGYVWLYVSDDGNWGSRLVCCPTRLIWGIPCPACGTTRAVRAIFHGEWLASLHYNPLGLVVSLAMVVVPIWIVADTVTGSSSLLRAYRFTERKLGQWPYAALGILLILANWIWNLLK
ncbi:MAG: DUF2752 domain-containing protein [Bacteroidaceae bacterium]|nr:DUF2752 domain-containing protein [Bacteroidaceae bacterium]